MINQRIWVAEDDFDDTMFIKNAFKSIHLDDVRFFENGKLLTDQLVISDELPFLVITDLNMPLLDGKGVINIFKNNPKTLNIPLIVLSTSKDQRDIEHTLMLGASKYYYKPNNFGELVDILSEITNNWLNHEEN